MDILVIAMAVLAVSVAVGCFIAEYCGTKEDEQEQKKERSDSV
ncbi:MAG: hypothetical protein Q4D51_01730 [Eubacteriales bacterium]|nr:hypothetical protein [Eubacteriales bacterium]